MDWKIIGPGGGGGIFIPAVSPYDQDTVLAASDMMGAYVTHDGAKTWKMFNLQARVKVFTFDPVDPNAVYAGSCGLFRSDDRGDTWNLILPRPESITGERMVGDNASKMFIADDIWPVGPVWVDCVSIDRDNANSIWAGLFSRDGVSIVHSADRGESWRKAFDVPAGEMVHRVFELSLSPLIRIFIDPLSPESNRRIYIFTRCGIFTGSARNAGLTAVPLPEYADFIKYATAGVHPQTGRIAFYMIVPGKLQGDRHLSGILRSMDYGDTWEQLFPFGSDVPACQDEVPEFNHNGAETLVSDCRTIYLSVRSFHDCDVAGKKGKIHYGIVKSVDCGDTWSWVLKADDESHPANKKNGWLERNYGPWWGGSPIALGMQEGNPDICYAGDYGTAYRTMDGGKHWEQVYSNDQPDGSTSTRGLDVTTCYGVHFDPFDSGHIAISYTDIGLFDSRDGGGTWHHCIQGVPSRWANTCYWMVFDPEKKGHAWSAWAEAHDLPRVKMLLCNLSEYPGGVCKTQDGMRSWSRCNGGMRENCIAVHIALDASSDPESRILYVADFGYGVYKTCDGGNTWEPKNNGIEENRNAWKTIVMPDGALYLVIVRGIDGENEMDGAIYVSKDGAESWVKMALPQGANAPTDLIYDPENVDRLYLACWPKRVDGMEKYGGLYVTEDGGSSWDTVFNPSAYVYGIDMRPDNPAVLFINTFGGAAFRSEDRGVSWKRLGGYDFKRGHRPVADPLHKGMLYLTTFGGSVWHGPEEGV